MFYLFTAVLNPSKRDQCYCICSESVTPKQ